MNDILCRLRTSREQPHWTQKGDFYSLSCPLLQPPQCPPQSCNKCLQEPHLPLFSEDFINPCRKSCSPTSPHLLVSAANTRSIFYLGSSMDTLSWDLGSEVLITSLPVFHYCLYIPIHQSRGRLLQGLNPPSLHSLGLPPNLTSNPAPTPNLFCQFSTPRNSLYTGLGQMYYAILPVLLWNLLILTLSWAASFLKVPLLSPQLLSLAIPGLDSAPGSPQPFNPCLSGPYCKLLAGYLQPQF